MTLSLNRSTWTRIKFGDVIESVTDRVDNPSKAGVDRYVGLEHLDPGSMTVTRWGTPDQVEAQKLRFLPGDVIFGRRRAYQKKVARADFEGICSAHALVLRAKPGKIDPNFLPVFLSSDVFLDRAVKISVGSLSPTVNWKMLAVQEFVLPPLGEQKRVADLLVAVEAHRKGLRTLSHALEAATSTVRASLIEALTAAGACSLNDLVGAQQIELGRGKVIPKTALRDTPGEYPVYSSAQKNQGAIGAYGRYMFDEELITWSIDGGGMPFHRPQHKFSVTNVGGYLRILDTECWDYRFLYEIMDWHWENSEFDWQNKAHPSVLRTRYNRIPRVDISNQLKLLDDILPFREAMARLDAELSQLTGMRASLLAALFDGGEDTKS